MNYLLIYQKIIDQIIENHDKRRDRMQKVFKSFVSKVLPQPWMAPISLVGLEWFFFKSVGLIILKPLGKVIFSSLSILCTGNFCSSLSDVLGIMPWMFCFSFIQTFSSGEVFNRKLSIVFFKWTPTFFSKNNYLIIGDQTQRWYLIQGIFSKPPNFANMYCSSPL